MRRSACWLLALAVTFSMTGSGCGGDSGTTGEIPKDEQKALDSATIDRMKGATAPPKKKQ